MCYCYSAARLIPQMEDCDMLESKVLLIEDDPAIVENLSAYLKEERFEVTGWTGRARLLRR